MPERPSPIAGNVPRLVVVTGAASGVGLATTRALIDAGATVIGVDVAPRPAEPAAADMLWVEGDVGDENTWREVLATAQRSDPLGADGLVACAGDVVVAPFLDTPVDKWRRMLEVNVIGVVRAFHALLPSMIARGRGAVVAVCSVNSMFVEDGLSAYSTSKAAALHVVRAAALEHARHGIRINAVCPGAVDTPMLRRHLDTTTDPAATRRAVEQRTPTGNILRPDEVAAVAVFLLSASASGMSGAAVVVDGGLTTTYDFGTDSSQ